MKPKKYTYADHLDAYPEIATLENAEALLRLSMKGWCKRARIAEVSAMATRLKVPNSKRENQAQMVEFLDTLMWPLWSQVFINEEGITVGYELEGSRVKKIGRDRRATLENGERVSIHHPRYDQLYQELRY